MEDFNIKDVGYRVDKRSGAVILPPDTPAQKRRKQDKNKLDKILEGMFEIKTQVSELTEEVEEIKKLILEKANN